MLASMTITDKRRFSLLLLLATVIALYFWTQSRLPALDHKAQMGQRATISSLSFDVVIPAQAEDSYVDRVYANSVNWCYTNWKGMTFGLSFAAALLAMMTLVKTGPRRRLSLFLQSVLGTLIGTPLGVCANCSTPIAVGMYRGGTPLGMALATISASPTLNIIVLTMAISLVPIELLVLKYVAVFVYLLVALPLLLHLIPSRLQQSYAAASDIEHAATKPFAPFAVSLPPATNWLQALGYALRSYLAALWFVVKSTLPFMILAGVLGVALAEAMPIKQLSGFEMSVGVLIVAAAVATVFPVPMAFDVVMTVSLLAMGVPVAYCAALFFALGIFSIYPGLIIARDISVRLSLAIGAVITLLAILVGLGAQFWVDTARADRVEQINQSLPQLQNDASGGQLLESTREELQALSAYCRANAASDYAGCLHNYLVRQPLAFRAALPCQTFDNDAASQYVCTQIQRIAQAQQQAIESKDIAACASLSAPERQNCQTEAAFVLASELSDLKYCEQLGQQTELAAQCQFEALSFRVELYDAQDMCAALGDAVAQERCQSQLAEIEVMNRHLQSNDLQVCLNLSDPNARQYCQGVVMVNLLEKGASPELCSQIQSDFLRQRCLHFVDYFKAQNALDGRACQNIPDPGLQQQCLQEVHAAGFEKQRQQLRYQRLGQVELVAPVVIKTSAIQIVPAAATPMADPNAGFELAQEGAGWALHAKTLAQMGGTESGFRSLDAQVMGLTGFEPMQADELFDPFTYGRGVASGDINNDFLPDLVFASGSQVRVYQNDGGKFALLQTLTLPVGEGVAAPILVALADLNGDGWDDLLASYYGAGVAIFPNRQGHFDTSATHISLADSNLVMAAGFVDADQDGDLDVVAGSWSFGDFRHFQPAFSRNYLLRNDGAFKFEPSALPGPDGETLSVLLSDLDHDGKTELAIANDREAPDLFYRWQDGAYQLSLHDPKLPGISSFNTMSMDSADINNDGHLDYFSVDMSFEPSPSRGYCDAVVGADWQQSCQQLLQEKHALDLGDVDTCPALSTPQSQQACLRAQLIQLAHDSQRPDYCERIPPSHHAALMLCRNGAMTLPVPTPLDFREFVPGVQRNVLMIKDVKSGAFVNRTNEMGVAKTRWSWNSRFADLDNDGWQDLYVGNGFMFGTQGRDIHSNMFFRNQKGERFEEQTSSIGLEDYLNTPSFTYLDLDADGDLDLVSTHVGDRPGVFVNHSEGNAIQFVLEDRRDSQPGHHRGNHRGIGAMIRIDYAGGSQMREIKLSGGYLSYDLPMAHFGLADHSSVSKVTVRWPDGVETTITQELVGGRLYRLIRR